MKIEQCIMVQVAPGSWQVHERVALECELLSPADEAWVVVRLLEAGAGLAAGAEITVPAAKVTV